MIGNHVIQLAARVPELDGIGSGHQHRAAASYPCSKDTSRVPPDERAMECARQTTLRRMTGKVKLKSGCMPPIKSDSSSEYKTLLQKQITCAQIR
jgi:hypothetical protein